MIVIISIFASNRILCYAGCMWFPRFLKNLKHIFVIFALVFLSVIVSTLPIFSDILMFLNKGFIYSSIPDTLPDTIYHEKLAPVWKQTRVILLTIDDESLNYLDANRIQFWKNIYSTLVKKLETAWVKGIGFDVIFALPDTAPSGVNGYTNEEEFAATMKQYKNIVIAADYDNQYCQNELGMLLRKYSGLNTKNENTYPWLDTTNCKKRLAGVIAYNRDKLVDFDKTKQYAEFLKKYEEKWENLENFADEDYRSLFCQVDVSGKKYETCLNVPRSIYGDIPWGMINVSKIHDISYSRPALAYLSGELPYASWKSGSGVLDESKYLYTLPLELYRLTGGDMNAVQDHIDTSSTILNPYFGREGSFTSISLKDVLRYGNNELRNIFTWSYVLVGNVQEANHDFIVSPVSGSKMAGVEIHAHFLEWLLQSSMLKKLGTMKIFFLLVFVSLVSVTLYFFSYKFLSPIIAIVIFFAILWTTRYIYDVHRVLIDIFPVFVAGVASYGITYIYKFFVVDREKRELQSNFAHYVDPLIVKKIAESGDPIELGGEKRELTILFSDIAGFTTISEQLPPQELFYLMTLYLSNMTDILIHEGGTLDKYIGDAVMGFFGAPLKVDDHAIRACRTALLMYEKLPSFNADIVAHGLNPIHFRVGIATGEVMVGNIGSHDRFNYTVLGDTVNLASRLEATGKEYGVSVIIAESVREKLSQEYYVRELDTIAVKGKTEWVRIYELVWFENKIDDRARFENYEKALGYYRKGEYREAWKIWANQMEEDFPSRVMAERCVAILQHEIVVENGIYRMTHK